MRAIGAIAVFAALAACSDPSGPAVDPSKVVVATPIDPETGRPVGASVVAAPSGAPAAQESPPVDLASLPAVAAPYAWSFADNVTYAPASADARGTFQSFQLTATRTSGLHRVGLGGRQETKPIKVRVTAWVKLSPGTDLMFELATVGTDNKLVNYGVSYFDVGGLKVVGNKVVTDKTQMKDVRIERDGEWLKVSGPIQVDDQQLSIVVGMVKNGSHVFAGTGNEVLTVGGVEVAKQ